MLVRLGAIALAILTAHGSPVVQSPRQIEMQPRVVVYYQHQWPHQALGVPPSDWGTFVSPIPLIGKASHLMVAAVHINGANSTDPITINDTPPSSPLYDQLWIDLQRMRDAGVKVLAMIGGAQPGGCFWRLSDEAKTFNQHYARLKAFLRKYPFDGVDLDVEELDTAKKAYSLNDMIYLIDRLRADFGKDYLITATPVAYALDPTNPDPEFGGISGFSYFELERQRGDEIAFYNAQFYEGWGELDEEDGIPLYERIAQHFPSHKVVAIAATNPSNVGNGYVDWRETAEDVLPVLSHKYSVANGGTGFGGVAGWEYFNSLPGGLPSPEQWADIMGNAMKL